MESNKDSQYQNKIAAQKIWYANQIRICAEQKHISWAELSILSGISEETINRIANGETIPSTSALKSIAVALEIPVDTLHAPFDL